MSMSEFSADEASVLDKYTLSMFITPEGRLNRELGSRIFEEYAEAIGVNNIEPTITPLDSLGVSSSIAFGFDMPVAGSNTEADTPAEKKITDEATELATRRQQILGLALYSMLEIEKPTAPINDTLFEDPYAELEVVGELDHYFSFMLKEQPTALEDIQDAAEQLGAARNPIDNEACIIAIPVAGHQESKNIYHTMEEFTRQSLPTDKFEVVLGINLPAPEANTDKTNREQQLTEDLSLTLGEIARFQQDHPDFPLRYYTHAYRGDPPTIGKIRSDLWAAIGLDAQKRGISKDILVVSSDADIIHLSGTYLESMAETFQETGADFVTAGLKWQMAPGLPYDAPVNKMLRYQTFLDSMRDKHSKFLHAADANTGISMAAYFAVGGYDRSATLGEMHTIVHTIRAFRNGAEEGYEPVKTVEAKAEGAWLKSHSRRLIRVMALGYSPYHAWDQSLITFGSDDSVRTAEMQVDEANKNVTENWKTWIKATTPAYTEGIPTTKKRRILKSARRILGYQDLYR